MEGHFVTLQYCLPPSTADIVGTSIPEYHLRSRGYLLDSNIVIDLMASETELPMTSLVVWISVISIVELSRSRVLTSFEIDTYLKSYLHADVSIVDLEMAHQARFIRSYTALKVPDALIAATAELKNLTLVTEDKQLSRVAGRNVINRETFMQRMENEDER